VNPPLNSRFLSLLFAAFFVEALNNIMGHPEQVDVIICGGGPAGISLSFPSFAFFFSNSL